MEERIGRGCSRDSEKLRHRRNYKTRKHHFFSLLLTIASISAPQACTAQQSLPDGQAGSGNLDLASTHSSISASLAGTIQIGGNLNAGVVSGGTPLQIEKGQLVTPAQNQALIQTNSGGQHLLITSSGSAAAGFTNLLATNGGSFSNVVVPGGVQVNAVNFTQNSALNITGNLSILGSLFLLQTTANASAVLNTGSLYIGPGGLLSGYAPPNSSVTGLTALASTGMNISVARDVVNSGTISTAGNLNIVAGGSISNLGQNGLTALINAQNILLASGVGNVTNNGVISALNSVTLSTIQTNLITQLSSLEFAKTVIESVLPHASSDLFVNNSGLVESVFGNIKIDAGGNLTVNNESGNFTARSGSIELRDSSYSGQSGATLIGGNFISESLNIYSGSGNVYGELGEVSGSLRTYAESEHFVANTPELIIGDSCIKGDPLFANTGNITISGALDFGSQPVSILAQGDIKTSNSAQIRTAGGALILVAGADFGCAGCGITGTPTPSPGNTSTVSGASIKLDNASGGNIDFTSGAASTVLITDGGAITLVANSNNAGNGNVWFSNSSTIDSSANRPGGKVLILAGGSGGVSASGAISNSIQVGSIVSGGRSAGAVQIYTATPVITGPSGDLAVFAADGSSNAQFVPQGGFDSPVVVPGGSVSTKGILAAGAGGDPFEPGWNGASVTIRAGGDISTGFIRTFGGGGGGINDNDVRRYHGGGSGGSIDLVSSAGSIVISGDLNSSGGGGGAAGYDLDLRLPGNGADISIRAAGSLTVDGPILAAGGALGGYVGGGGSYGGGGGGAGAERRGLFRGDGGGGGGGFVAGGGGGGRSAIGPTTTNTSGAGGGFQGGGRGGQGSFDSSRSYGGGGGGGGGAGTGGGGGGTATGVSGGTGGAGGGGGANGQDGGKPDGGAGGAGGFAGNGSGVSNGNDGGKFGKGGSGENSADVGNNFGGGGGNVLLRGTNVSILKTVEQAFSPLNTNGFSGDADSINNEGGSGRGGQITIQSPVGLQYLTDANFGSGANAYVFQFPTFTSAGSVRTNSNTPINILGRNYGNYLAPGFTTTATITEGSNSILITSGSKVTPAEAVAAVQLLSGAAQSLILSQPGSSNSPGTGFATGGSFTISASNIPAGGFSNLILPANVTSNVSTSALSISGSAVINGVLNFSADGKMLVSGSVSGSGLITAGQKSTLSIDAAAIPFSGRVIAPNVNLLARAGDIGVSSAAPLILASSLSKAGNILLSATTSGSAWLSDNLPGDNLTLNNSSAVPMSAINEFSISSRGNIYSSNYTLVALSTPVLQISTNGDIGSTSANLVISGPGGSQVTFAANNAYVTVPGVLTFSSSSNITSTARMQGTSITFLPGSSLTAGNSVTLSARDGSVSQLAPGVSIQTPVLNLSTTSFFDIGSTVSPLQISNPAGSVALTINARANAYIAAASSIAFPSGSSSVINGLIDLSTSANGAITLQDNASLAVSGNAVPSGKASMSFSTPSLVMQKGSLITNAFGVSSISSNSATNALSVNLDSGSKVLSNGSDIIFNNGNGPVSLNGTGVIQTTDSQGSGGDINFNAGPAADVSVSVNQLIGTVVGSGRNFAVSVANGNLQIGPISATADAIIGANGDIGRNIGTISAVNINLNSSNGNLGAGARYAPANIFVAATGLLTLNAKGNIAVTSVSSTQLGQSSGDSIQIATQNNGNIVLTDSISSQSQLTLLADGSGSILQNAGSTGVLTAGKLTLASASGNIGLATNPVLTQTKEITATTSDTGAVYITNTGSLILTSSAAGGSFTLNNSGTITTLGDLYGSSVLLKCNADILAANVSASSGDVSLICGTPGASSTLSISTGASIFANEGNVNVQNLDTFSGTIQIGSGASIAARTATAKNSIGQVFIYVGASPTLLPGAPPQNNITETITGGGFIFYGKGAGLGVTAAPPDNNLISSGGLIAFDAGSSRQNVIALQGAVTISSITNTPADPPLASLDLSNPAVINEVLTLQSHHYISGNLTLLPNGTLSGSATIRPSNLAATLFAVNIPASVSLNFSGFTQNTPINILLVPTSTTKQVIIAGTQSFIGAGSFGQMNISSGAPLPYPVLTVTGGLNADGSVGITSSGDMQLAGSFNINSANLNAISNGSIILNSSLTTSGALALITAGSGAIIQNNGFISGGSVVLISGTNLGSDSRPIVTSASTISAKTSASAFINNVGTSSPNANLYIMSSSAGNAGSFHVTNVAGGIVLNGGVSASVGTIGDIAVVAATGNISARAFSSLTATSYSLSAPYGSIGAGTSVQLGGGTLSASSARDAAFSSTAPLQLGLLNSGGTLNIAGSTSLQTASSGVIVGSSVTLSTPALALGKLSTTFSSSNLTISSPNSTDLVITGPDNSLATLAASAGIFIAPASQRNLTIAPTSALAPTTIAMSGQSSWLTSGSGAVAVASGVRVDVRSGNGQVTVSGLPATTLSLSGGGSLNAAGINFTAGDAGGSVTFNSSQTLSGAAVVSALSGMITANSGITVYDLYGITINSPNAITNLAAFQPSVTVNSQPPFNVPDATNSALTIHSSNVVIQGNIFASSPPPQPPPGPYPGAPAAQALPPAYPEFSSVELASIQGPQLGLAERVPTDVIVQRVGILKGAVSKKPQEISTNSIDSTYGEAVLIGIGSFSKRVKDDLSAEGILLGESNDDRTLSLERGRIFISSTRELLIKTPHGIVQIKPKAIVYLVESESGLAVFDLTDSRRGDVEVRSLDKQLIAQLLPGMELVLTTASVGEENALPDNIPYRQLHKVTSTKGITILSAEYSISTLLTNISSIRKLIRSDDASERGFIERVLKMAIIAQTLSAARGPFRMP